jgi:hypothetical protein
MWHVMGPCKELSTPFCTTAAANICGPRSVDFAFKILSTRGDLGDAVALELVYWEQVAKLNGAISTDEEASSGPNWKANDLH